MKQFTMGAVVNTINNSTLLENYYVTKKVKIMLGTDLLLFTNNNINAYKKLWKALEGVEAKPFIIELEGTKVFESADKHTLYKELNKFLEN
jgi:hypothetical protein